MTAPRTAPHEADSTGQQTSVRRRLMRVVMTTTFLALLLSAVALLIYELQTRRVTWLGELQTQSTLIAQASLPALNFDDRRVAAETLDLLRLRPEIEAAALYGNDGRLFASYVKTGESWPPPPRAQRNDGPVFDGQRVLMQQRIEQDGELAGTVVLQARYAILPRLLGYVIILAIVMLASLALAALVANNLQRAITDPIVSVASVARQVVQRRDYALRARKTTQDEVGALVDAFNNMLQELGDQAQELRAADGRKDVFLATLAHELRNPLAPLSTGLLLLARDELDPAGRERVRQMMQRQLAQLVRLVDDLLEVSRISTGRLHLRMEKLNLVDAVRSAYETVDAAAQERLQHIEVDWPAAEILVEGDRTRLAQVFANLLSNAVRYTEPGGRIAIRFQATRERVEVQVEDNGIGIDPAMQGQVFELFVQVDKSLGRGRAGLGVGLSLARELVRLHGGTIALRSAGLRQGSTFVVSLPRLTATAPAEEPAATPAPASVPGQVRVLIADDNRDYADSLAEVLRMLGCEVRLCYDGPSALEVANAWLPDFGLFDIGMPGMDGYALAFAVREGPSGDRIVLIAVTGWGQEQDQLRAQGAGFDEHFVKPVDIGKLAALLALRQSSIVGHGAAVDGPRSRAPTNPPAAASEP